MSKPYNDDSKILNQNDVGLSIPGWTADKYTVYDAINHRNIYRYYDYEHEGQAMTEYQYLLALMQITSAEWIEHSQSNSYYAIIDGAMFYLTTDEYVRLTNTIISDYDDRSKEEESENKKSDNPSDLVSSNQSDNKVGMENFSKVLNKLNDKICNGRAVYTMYFKMNLTAGGVLVDTTSEDWLENNLVSFTHKIYYLNQMIEISKV